MRGRDRQNSVSLRPTEFTEFQGKLTDFGGTSPRIRAMAPGLQVSFSIFRKQGLERVTQWVNQHSPRRGFTKKKNFFFYYLLFTKLYGSQYLQRAS